MIVKEKFKTSLEKQQKSPRVLNALSSRLAISSLFHWARCTSLWNPSAFSLWACFFQVTDVRPRAFQVCRSQAEDHGLGQLICSASESLCLHHSATPGRQGFEDLMNFSDSVSGSQASHRSLALRLGRSTVFHCSFRARELFSFPKICIREIVFQKALFLQPPRTCTLFKVKPQLRKN